MKKYTYLLFDLDGTISDPKEGITKSFQYALKHFGIQVDNLDPLEPVIGPPLKGSFMEFYNLTEEEAHQTECYLIHSYVFEEGYGLGCKGHEKKSGTPYLTNSTWGGEGCSGVIITDETKKKISKANKGKKHQSMTEETKIKIGNSNRGKSMTEEAKRKLSETQKLRWQKIKLNL